MHFSNTAALPSLKTAAGLPERCKCLDACKGISARKGKRPALAETVAPGDSRTATKSLFKGELAAPKEAASITSSLAKELYLLSVKF